LKQPRLGEAVAMSRGSDIDFVWHATDIWIMARAGKRALSNAWQLRRAQLRKHRKPLTLWILAYSSIFLTIRLLPFPNRPFWYGATAVAWVWLAEAAMFHGDRASSVALGGVAEQWTSAALRKLGRGRWRVIDRVDFEDMDVDHVVIGPAGVLAVETKWSSEWRYEGGKLQFRFGDPIGQARRGARKIRYLLLSYGIHVDPVPVLCLWGPGLPDFPDGADWAGDVLLLHGKQAKAWRPLILRMESRFGADKVGSIAQGVSAFVQQRDEYELYESLSKKRGRPQPPS
jgi:hypothetical protein